MSFKENIMQKSGKLLNKCVKNNGLFLFASLATAWLLASTAQTFGLVFNKKIPKEKKKFLVPQEIMDGAFNIATYAAITVPLMAGAGKIAKKNFKNEAAIEGAKTIAAVAGGILSSNIITPLLRNKTSVIIKNKMEKANGGEPVKPIIYNGKSYPYFRANQQPLTMTNYAKMTKTMPNNGLKI